MANINSKTEARKKVREAQAKANEARQERERHNVDDAASFLVELGRLAAVDEWEQGRVVEIRAEGERRRHEHRQEGAAAVSRMLDRGETVDRDRRAGRRQSQRGARRAEISRRRAGRAAGCTRRARGRAGCGQCRAGQPWAWPARRCAQAVLRREACASAGYCRRCGCGWLWSSQDARGFRPRMTVSSPFVLPAVMNALSVNRSQHGFC